MPASTIFSRLGRLRFSSPAGVKTREYPATQTEASRRAGWPDSLWALIKNNLLFELLLAGGIALRVMVMLAYKPALLLVMDAQAYLRRSVYLDLSPTVFRPMLYPLLIKPLLAFGPGAVALVQHIAGLGMAVIVYLLLKRRLGCSKTLAALATIPVLFDGYQLDIEHYILTETFFELAIVGAITLLCWSGRASIPAVFGAGLLLAAAGLIRYVGLALIVPALVYVVVRKVGLVRLITLLVAFALPLAAYALWAKQSTGDLTVTSKNGFFLYGRVASFAQCKKIDPPPRLRKFCPVVPPDKRPEIRGIWDLTPDVVGFNIRKLFNAPRANQRLSAFAKRAILAQPTDYAAVVGHDLWRFFSPAPAPTKEPNVRTWRFPRTMADASPNPIIVKLHGSAPPGMGFDRFQIHRPLADRLRSYQDYIYLWGPALLILLCLGLIGMVLGRPSHRGRPLRAESFLFTAAAFTLLAGAVMTTVYHFRYWIPVIPLVGPAGMLGVTTIVERMRALRRGPAQHPATAVRPATE